MDRDEAHSSDDNTIPSMDNDSKNMLDAIYANMDPASPATANLNDHDQTRCETR